MADTILEEIAANARERVAAAKAADAARGDEAAQPGRWARKAGFPFETALRGKDYRLHLRGKKSLPL